MSNRIVLKSFRIAFVCVFAATLSACMTRSPFGDSLNATQSNPQHAPPKTALARGKRHFLNGNYGSAERYFRIAVEKSANDVNAWIGLAASYDRLSRFKLAKRAYAQAIELGGKTPMLLNNQGYSYLLQGKLKKARRNFLIAARKAPDNIHIKNNLALVHASQKRIAANSRSLSRQS